MVSKKVTQLNLSASAQAVLDEDIDRLRQRVIDRASKLAEKSGLVQSSESDVSPITPANVSRAFMAEAGNVADWWDGFFGYFPPFLIVCTILCIAFALLGFKGTPTDDALASGISGAASAAKHGAVSQSTLAGFLDIAKIFAGAIVGSASGAVAAKLRKQAK